MSESYETQQPDSAGFLSDALYNKIRILALYVLPALGTLYFGLAEIWGLPKADEVVGTIVVIDTFLGALLGFAKRQYDNDDSRFDGVILVSEDTENSLTNMNVTLNPRSVQKKRELRVRVKDA